MKLLLPTIAVCIGGTVAAWTRETPALAVDSGYDGVVQPHRVVQLGAATDGLLERVLFERGARIEAGDVVATLDVRVVRAQADLARTRAERDSALAMVAARLKDARRRLALQEELLAKKIATPESVGTIRTEVELEALALRQQQEEQKIAQVELRRAQATLDLATITSPLAGVVIARHLSPGEYYSRTGERGVLTIAELDPLVVEVNLPVERFDDIQVGDKARVELDAPGRPMREAEVRTKDHVVDTASRTFQVQLTLNNPDYEFPAGLRCHVDFHE